LISAARERVPGDFTAAQLSLAGLVVEPSRNGAASSIRVAS
jgi:hypothetical protein